MVEGYTTEKCKPTDIEDLIDRMIAKSWAVYKINHIDDITIYVTFVK